MGDELCEKRSESEAGHVVVSYDMVEKIIHCKQVLAPAGIATIHGASVSVSVSSWDSTPLRPPLPPEPTGLSLNFSLTSATTCSAVSAVAVSNKKRN